MDFCKSTPEHHWYTVKIYFSNLPGTVFSAWVSFVLDCRAAQPRFRQQNFTAGFRSPDSGSLDSAVLDSGSPIPAESPLSPSPLHLSLLSISLTSHSLSPVLDFFDRGILCHEISMSSGSGMVMGCWRS